MGHRLPLIRTWVAKAGPTGAVHRDVFTSPVSRCRRSPNQTSGPGKVSRTATTALYPDMPLSAIERVDVDYCLPVAKIGTVLYQLTHEPPIATVPIPGDLLVEADIAEYPSHSSNRIKELGALVPLICPDCGGPLWELRRDNIVRYRCRLGHAFMEESLLEGQSEVLEQALWAAVHTMEERMRVLTSLASGRRERGQEQLAELYEARATELQTHTQQLRQMLLGDARSCAYAVPTSLSP